jgi:predicted nucleotidyltransferase
MVRLPHSAGAALALLEAAPAVRRIILFGSRAVGDEEERSDIDLAISAPDLDATGVARLRDAVSTTRTLYKISVTRIEDMPASLKSRVLKQGKTIYERA